MRIEVTPDGAAATRGTLGWPGGKVPCALGRSGVTRHKREGDGATPAGVYALRRVLYRADRGGRPETQLPVEAIFRTDGWCDDPNLPDYNRQIILPASGSAERLWREDGLYDLVVILGHNDSPPVAGAGSAIFLHVAAAGYAPTEGCVAVAPEDLRAILAGAAPGDDIAIMDAGA